MQKDKQLEISSAVEKVKEEKKEERSTELFELKKDTAASMLETKASVPAKEAVRKEKVDTASVIVQKVQPDTNEVKQATVNEIKQPAVNNETIAAIQPAALEKLASIASEEGEFISLYVERKNGNEKRNGMAATFKSTSGWQDKKYYVLVNNIEPGTIVKIAANNKVVYAKVLGSLPEMKENNGLLLRMSNAAASYLGIIDPKFTVDISY